MRVWGCLVFLPCSGKCYRRDDQVSEALFGATIDLLCALRLTCPLGPQFPHHTASGGRHLSIPSTTVIRTG